MKTRGFTLLELMIVMVIMGIGAAVSMRFISSMAHTQVASTERNQALSGARFAIERLRRELSQAYSPSVYISDNGSCVHFVPVIAAGAYNGQVENASAIFNWPLSQQDKTISFHMAVNPASAGPASAWQNYPNTLPENVSPLVEDLLGLPELAFDDVFDSNIVFNYDSAKHRYTLLKPETVSFCASEGELRRYRQQLDMPDDKGSLMLTSLKSDKLFGDYNERYQILPLIMTLTTRDGDIVLPTQLQVNYEP